MRARNVNFRETHSERSATRSYKGFVKFMKQKFTKLSFKKYGKN